MEDKNSSKPLQAWVVMSLIAISTLSAFIAFMMIDSKISSDATKHIDKAIHTPNDENINKALHSYDKTILKTSSLREGKDELNKLKAESDKLKTESEDAETYVKVNELVKNAEKNKSTQNRKIAKIAVNEMQNIEQQQEFQERLVSIEQEIEKKQILEAQVSVDVAVQTPRKATYTLAQSRVDNLADSKAKDELNARLNAVTALN